MMKTIDLILRLAASALIAAVALVSCSKEETPEQLASHRGYDTFVATIEQPETKVYVDDQMRVLWHADDCISIFNQYTYNQQYRFEGETGDNSGSFVEVSSGAFITGNVLPSIWAVYPYRSDTRISNDGELSINYPANQLYAANSFGLGATTMVSATSDNKLLFKNAVGILVLKLYGSDVSVSSITLTGNNGEKLSGAAKVTMPVDDVPVVTMKDQASESVTLTCETPVVLGSSASDYTEFWFALPPTEFTGGITIDVESNGKYFIKTTSSAFTIARSKISRLAPLEVVLTDHLSFTEHNPSYWFNDIDAEVYNTVRRNVPVPEKWVRDAESGNTDVTQFTKVMTDDWVGNTVKILKGGTEYTAEEAGVDLEWSFAPHQPAIANPEGAGSHAWTSDNKTITQGQVSKLYYPTHSSDPVITLNPSTGELTYVYQASDNYISKQLLNMFPSTSRKVEEMLYCAVRITAFEKDTRNELYHEDINVRFLRPVTVDQSKAASLQDAMPGGSHICVADLFVARDWNANSDNGNRGYTIWEYNNVKKTYKTMYYTGDSDKQVEWLGYYGFDSFEVDIDHIYTDQLLTKAEKSKVGNMTVEDALASYPNFGLLYSINPSARLHLSIKEADGTFTAIAQSKIDISDVVASTGEIRNLGRYYLSYENNNGVVSDFSIWVPATFKYSWGLQKTVCKIPVKATKVSS